MKKRVLVVEDTVDALDNLRDLLEMEGFEVVTAANGQEGLDKLYLYKPDLVISDLRMPKMDGFEFLKTIKGSTEFRSVDVVIFSANATPENEKRCLDLGALKFIKKPCPTEQLLTIIHNIVNRDSP